MTVRDALAAGFLMGLVGLAGCGKGNSAPKEKTVRVGGTVTYQGRPVTDAAIAFVPDAKDGRGAFGRTDEAGKFRLMTFVAGDGAVPGSYKVTVAKQSAEAPPATAETGDANYVDPESAPAAKRSTTVGMVPPKYSAVATTPLTATVADGSNPDLTLELKD